ncbi:MAG: hypothetical protein M3Q03_09890 [Chloroflexota bacterium]|nr:hypothetical protein [Chloroflexota bacterium]
MKIDHPLTDDEQGIVVRLDPEADYLILIDSCVVPVERLAKIADHLRPLERANRKILLMAVSDVEKSVRFVKVPSKGDDVQA